MVQEIPFKLDAPGPGRGQEQPRPHHVALDPTGRFLLSADLGADLIRVFNVSQDHHIKEVQGLSLPTGSFPRHVAWVSLKDRLQLYVLLQELNALIVYKVDYTESGALNFFKEDSFPVIRDVDGSGIVWTEANNLKASHIAVSVSPVAHFLINI